MLAPTTAQLTEAVTQKDRAGPKSRRPKPGTAKAATVRDEGDPAKGAHTALLKLDRHDRVRDGELSTRVVILHGAGPHHRAGGRSRTFGCYAAQWPRPAWR
jgi:hypothetical protein